MIFPVSRFTRKAKGVIRKTGSESFRPFRNHAFILWQSTHHFQLAVPVWFFAANPNESGDQADDVIVNYAAEANQDLFDWEAI